MDAISGKLQKHQQHSSSILELANIDSSEKKNFIPPSFLNIKDLPLPFQKVLSSHHSPPKQLQDENVGKVPKTLDNPPHKKSPHVKENSEHYNSKEEMIKSLAPVTNETSEIGNPKDLQVPNFVAGTKQTNDLVDSHKMGKSPPCPGTTKAYFQPKNEIPRQPISEVEKMLKDVNYPIIGLGYIMEFYHKEHPSLPRIYKCVLCKIIIEQKNIISHLKGKTHKMKYMRCHFETEFLHIHKKNLPPAKLEQHLFEWATKMQPKISRGIPHIASLTIQGAEKMRLPMASKSCMVNSSSGSLGALLEDKGTMTNERVGRKTSLVKSLLDLLPSNTTKSLSENNISEENEKDCVLDTDVIEVEEDLQRALLAIDLLTETVLKYHFRSFPDVFKKAFFKIFKENRNNQISSQISKAKEFYKDTVERIFSFNPNSMAAKQTQLANTELAESSPKEHYKSQEPDTTVSSPTSNHEANLQNSALVTKNKVQSCCTNSSKVEKKSSSSSKVERPFIKSEVTNTPCSEKNKPPNLDDICLPPGSPPFEHDCSKEKCPTWLKNEKRKSTFSNEDVKDLCKRQKYRDIASLDIIDLTLQDCDSPSPPSSPAKPPKLKDETLEQKSEPIQVILNATFSMGGFSRDGHDLDPTFPMLPHHMDSNHGFDEKLEEFLKKCRSSPPPSLTNMTLPSQDLYSPVDMDIEPNQSSNTLVFTRTCNTVVQLPPSYPPYIPPAPPLPNQSWNPHPPNGYYF